MKPKLKKLSELDAEIDVCKRFGHNHSHENDKRLTYQRETALDKDSKKNTSLEQSDESPSDKIIKTCGICDSEFHDSRNHTDYLMRVEEQVKRKAQEDMEKNFESNKGLREKYYNAGRKKEREDILKKIHDMDCKGETHGFRPKWIDADDLIKQIKESQ